MIRGFVILLDRRYVKWTAVGVYELVSNPALATRYPTSKDAMQARPWIRDLEGEQHPYQVGHVVFASNAITTICHRPTLNVNPNLIGGKRDGTKQRRKGTLSLNPRTDTD